MRKITIFAKRLCAKRAKRKPLSNKIGCKKNLRDDVTQEKDTNEEKEIELII